MQVEDPMDWRKRIRNLAKLGLCAGALAVLSVEAAPAAPALAVSNVNLRQGPGTNYGITTTIPGGSTVDVAGCTGEWCTVHWEGQTGYVIARNLDLGDPGPGPGPVAAGPPVVYYDPPPVIVGPPYYYSWGPRPYWGPRWGWRRW